MAIKVRVMNTGEEKIVDSSEKLYVGPRRHHTFSLEFIRATIYLQYVFHKVDPSPFIKWFEDFDRDANPEKELKIWLHLAKCFEKLTKKSTDINKDKQTYKVLLSFSTGMTPEEVSVSKDITLTKKEIKQIYDSF